MSEPVLTVEGLSVRFGGVTALADASFQVAPGELLAIIGPNGAGKSSLFNALTGIYPATGSARFHGREIIGLRPAAIASLGIARTFQNLGLFDSQSVIANLLIGRHTRMRGGVAAGASWVGRAKREDRLARIRCHELLAFLDLTRYAYAPVGRLPFGIKKKVEFARALAADPTILLLDEPVAGMNSDESEEIADLIVHLRDQMHLTIVLVEHDMPLVMRIAERIVVLDFGRAIAEGSPEAIQRDPKVIEAYLGTPDEDASLVERALQPQLGD